MPRPWRALSRSRSQTAPSTTVNGAEDWSTSDARPVGIPASIARYRNANCRMPNPNP
jgi:hypothetical protein